MILTEYFPDILEPVFTGGVESRVFHLVKHLMEKNTVDVIKRTDIYSFNSPIAIIHRGMFFLHQLIKIIFISTKYDIVEGTNFVTYILAFLYAKKIGAKAVAWYPDVFIGQGVERLGLLSGIATEFTERLAIKLPWDGIIALSEETKKKLILRGTNPGKPKVIYGGVENQKYKKVQESTHLRQATEGQARKYKEVTILCIARLVKYKRTQDLLLAIYFLHRRYRDIRVIIVGNGPMKNYLIKLSRQLGTYERISWMNGVSENQKWELLTRSHIHVLPSVVEGFGLVTVESLASGTPVVNADIPINREILEKEEVRRKKEEGNIEEGLVQGGLLFKAGDAVDLAEKIETLLVNRKLYNQKVSEAYELVRKYDWEKVNRQTEEFYQHLLSN